MIKSTINTSASLAIMTGKLSAKAIRLMNVGLGSNVPGRLARMVSPEVLSRLSKQARNGIIAVSGTNGKSTTSGLIYSILRRAGFKTVHNRQGANLITGITACLIEAADWQGNLDADYCLFEVDEASLPVVAREISFSAVVVTNLFRDQLDRFGELDTTATLISKGINNSQAILNADDPNVAQLAPNAPRWYFGIESLANENESLTNNGASELSYCAICGQEYAYSLSFYCQLGHYHCQACNNTRPNPQISAHEVLIRPYGSSFILKTSNQSIKVELKLPGLFNVYNALSAAALALWLDIPLVTIEDGLSKYTTLFGRSEHIEIAGKSVIIQLIKNPAGASQVVQSAAQDKSARILIAINDNLADGRDISWLWDADFELLSNYKKEMVVSGQRAYDMALRMKYAGLPSTNITVKPSLEAALKYALDSLTPQETLWILPTYTCLLELQQILKSMGYLLSGT